MFMKKILTAVAVACAAFAYAAPAQAITRDLTFNNPVTPTGTPYEVGSSYRYSLVTPGVDMLVTITGKSANAKVTDIFGDAPYYDGADDNFQLQLTRTTDSNGQFSEIDTFVNLRFDFVGTGTTTAVAVSNTILTFADIDSEFNMPFTDYVEFRNDDFNQVLLSNTTSLLHSTDVNGVTRYYGPDNQGNVATTAAEQADVSVNVVLDGQSGFNLTWGYQGAGNIYDRGLLMDGSNELQINAVPEPASIALLGLGSMIVLARVNGRSSRRR